MPLPKMVFKSEIASLRIFASQQRFGFKLTSFGMGRFFSTQRLYFDDTYLFKAQAIVMEVGKDDNGDFVVLDKTIFHP